MLRKVVALAALSFALAGWAAADDRHRDDRHRDLSVKIMTQNMDDGTDQTYIIAALLGQLPLPDAVDLTFAELQASDFEGRAMLLAERIAHEKPDLVALQEAVLWRFGPSPDKAKHVLYDNVDLLLSALKKLKVHYDVVTMNILSDVSLPGNQIGGALRFTDRNAVLVRSDLKRPNFYLSNVQARTFDAAFLFPPDQPLTITAGWISVDVHMGNKQFRFVTTHLESPIQGIQEATGVQILQAQQLIDDLSNTRMPVVICGDFNSDANRGGGVEDTGTFHLFELADYADAWLATNSSDPGFTWPSYLEDQFPPSPFFAPSTPVERIDLFFSKGMDIVSSELVIIPAPADPVAPPFASDHAGVIAIFRP